MSRTRFAPSPTGDLHVGGAWTALASFAVASGSPSVLRVEDLDTPRMVAGSLDRILDDLAWLGLSWDEGPARGGPGSYVQSERTALYEEALSKLFDAGLVYPCDCSRAEIARVASAPHAGEELVYPGTCRTKDPGRELRRPPALRLAVPADTTTSFDDAVTGTFTQRIDLEVGDFVLRRGDGIFAYQLACAVDDASMGIELVVRGDDLRASTPRQLLLMRLLGFAQTPAYAHVPLVVGRGGQRLAKRERGATIRDLRAQGLSPAEVVGELARGLGLTESTGPLTPDAVAASLVPPARWRRDPWPLPRAWC